MAEYGLEDVFEDVVLKLDGAKFRIRDRTRSFAAKVRPFESRFTEVDERDDVEDQELVDLMIDFLDVVLEPLGDDNGTRKHAKPILARSYKNEEIGLGGLTALMEFVQEKMASRGRPTSAATTGG